MGVAGLLETVITHRTLVRTMIATTEVYEAGGPSRGSGHRWAVRALVVPLLFGPPYPQGSPGNPGG